MSVRMRQEVERKIVGAFVNAALAAGYTVVVDDGEERHSGLTTLPAILDKMFSVDDEHLLLMKDGKRVGWVRLVYGNDGWDVICDYSANTATEVLMADAEKISDYYGGDGPWVPFTGKLWPGAAGLDVGTANAADELRAALQAFVEFYDRHGGTNNMATPQAEYTAAKAALAKAKQP